MKLVEQVLLNEIKKDPVKVRHMVTKMDTLDFTTKSQIIALTFVYEQPNINKKLEG